MRSIGIALAAAFLCFAGPTAAAKPKRIPAVLQSEVERATSLGKLIYAYDQAAWHGTDAMLAKVQNPEDKIGGWIVIGPVDAPELIFYDNDKAEPHRVFVAQFKGTRLQASRVVGATEDRALTPEQRRMIAARDAAVAALKATNPPRCSPGPMNSVVLPTDGNGTSIVYLLAAQPDLETFPIGGNYRVEISSDGKAGDLHRFANSCIAASGGNIVGMVLTHLLDPQPTEIHVFASLAAQRPIFLATSPNSYAWMVDRGKISLVDDKLGK